MTDLFADIKVAAVQAAPIYMDREATIEKTCRLMEEVGDQGVKIVAFPESRMLRFLLPLKNPLNLADIPSLNQQYAVPLM